MWQINIASLMVSAFVSVHEMPKWLWRVFVIEAINDRIAPFISLGHRCGNLRLTVGNIFKHYILPKVVQTARGRHEPV